MGGYFMGFPEVRFLDELSDNREVFSLLRPFIYHSDLLKIDVTVPAGFVSDGESVPRALIGFTGRPSIRAGIVHDWLYQAHKIALLDDHEIVKDLADRVYLEAMTAAGVDEIHGAARYDGVKFFGRSSWDSGPSRRRVLLTLMTSPVNYQGGGVKS